MISYIGLVVACPNHFTHKAPSSSAKNKNRSKAPITLGARRKAAQSRKGANAVAPPSEI